MIQNYEEHMHAFNVRRQNSHGEAFTTATTHTPISKSWAQAFTTTITHPLKLFCEAVVHNILSFHTPRSQKPGTHVQHNTAIEAFLK
jgi:hypothetical protein